MGHCHSTVRKTKSQVWNCCPSTWVIVPHFFCSPPNEFYLRKFPPLISRAALRLQFALNLSLTFLYTQSWRYKKGAKLVNLMLNGAKLLVKVNSMQIYDQWRELLARRSLRKVPETYWAEEKCVFFWLCLLASWLDGNSIGEHATGWMKCQSRQKAYLDLLAAFM